MIIEKFRELIDDMIATKIPDIHLTTGSCPHIRKHSGDIELIEKFGTLSGEDIDAIVIEMIGKERADILRKHHEGDFSYAYGEHKFRVNVFENSK